MKATPTIQSANLGRAAAPVMDGGAAPARVLLSVLAWALCLTGCGSTGAPDPAEGVNESDATLAFLNHSPDAEYVGSDTCRSCHLQIHSTYSKTGMGRAFHPVDDSIAVEDWSGENVVSVMGDVRYRMFKRDGAYWQRQWVDGPQGEELHAVEHELEYAIGSNNHNRGFVTLVEGKWFQAPMCWYPQTEKWDLCPGFERKNDHFSREVSESCIFCHNGVMELEEGERNVFKEPIPHGIGCERCHGPGSLHVDQWSEGQVSAAGSNDPTIVNPRHLDHEGRMSICSQCHLGDARASERVARYNRDLRDYRPGMPITDWMMPFRYIAATRHDFSISAQVDRLIMSECYLQSDSQLDCMSCHNPHVTTYQQQPSDYNAVCSSCHTVDDACTEQPEIRAEVQDNCIQCHMRKAEPDDQRMTAFTDHWIRTRIDDEERDLRTDNRLEPMYPERFAEMSAGEQAYVEGRAHFLLGNEATPAWRPQMYGRAEERFRAAIDAGFENGPTWFFLGKAILQQNRLPEAHEAFARALELAPEYDDAALSVAQTLNAMGRGEEAITVLQTLLERNADHALALAEFGLASWTQGRYGEALAAYERAAKVEPWNPLIQTNLGMTLSSVGRFDDAAWISERAVKLDPDDPRAWNLYFNAMREAGRAQEARFGQVRLQRLTRGM